MAVRVTVTRSVCASGPGYPGPHAGSTVPGTRARPAGAHPLGAGRTRTAVRRGREGRRRRSRGGFPAKPGGASLRVARVRALGGAAPAAPAGNGSARSDPGHGQAVRLAPSVRPGPGGLGKFHCGTGAVRVRRAAAPSAHGS